MEKSIYYGIFTGHDANRTTKEIKIGFDVLVGDEIKHLELPDNQETIIFGQTVLFDIANNKYVITDKMPEAEWAEFEKAYLVKYEAYKKYAKENNLSAPKYGPKPKDDISGFIDFFKSAHEIMDLPAKKHRPAFEDYYIGFTFDGRILPLRKSERSIAPFVNEELLTFISLRNENEVFHTDFTPEYLDKFGIWGLRPFSKFINDPGEMSEEALITISYQLIPGYLKEEVIVQKLFKQIKAGKIAIAHQYLANQPDKNILHFLSTVQNFEEITRMYSLIEPLDDKGLVAANFWNPKH